MVAHLQVSEVKMLVYVCHWLSTEDCDSAHFRLNSWQKANGKTLILLAFAIIIIGLEIKEEEKGYLETRLVNS